MSSRVDQAHSEVCVSRKRAVHSALAQHLPGAQRGGSRVLQAGGVMRGWLGSGVAIVGRLLMG